MDRLDQLKSCVSSKIYDRGIAYFEEGAVRNLTVSEPGRWEAQAAGNALYRLAVRLKGQEIVEATCNCPYAEERYCKHLVAMLLAIQERQAGGKEAVGPYKQTFSELIESASLEGLRQLALNFGSHSQEFQQFAQLHLAQPAEGLATERKRIGKLVEATISQYQDRYSFIEYDDMYALTDLLSQYLDTAEQQLEGGQHLSAVATCLEVARQSVALFECTDDDGSSLEACIQEAIDTLGAFYPSLAPAEKAELFMAVAEEARNSDYGNYGSFDIEWIKLLSQLAETPAQLSQLQAFLDIQIKEGSAWSSSSLIMAQYRLYRKNPQLSDADQFLYQHLDIHECLMEAIRLATDKEDWKEAIRLAESGLEQKNNFNKAEFYSILETLYGKTGQHARKQQLLRQWLYERLYSKDLYLRWKETYGQDAEAWQKAQNGFIAHLHLLAPNNESATSGLAEIYAHEGRPAELMKVVRGQRSGFLLQHYRKQLYAYSPEETLALFNRYIEEAAAKSDSRYDYQQLAGLLKMLVDLGVREQAFRLRDQLVAAYPRRRAMRDELGKV
jgi:hypothetical protein